MDLVTRKYAPSTLPYPLLCGGGSADEETDDVDDAHQVYDDTIAADIKQEDSLDLDAEARYFVDAYTNANFMQGCQSDAEEVCYSNHGFGYVYGNEDDHHGACYAYEDEDDDPVVDYENGQLDPDVFDCYV